MSEEEQNAQKISGSEDETTEKLGLEMRLKFWLASYK
jgi:hypothetical protein